MVFWNIRGTPILTICSAKYTTQNKKQHQHFFHFPLNSYYVYDFLLPLHNINISTSSLMFFWYCCISKNIFCGTTKERYHCTSCGQNSVLLLARLSRPSIYFLSVIKNCLIIKYRNCLIVFLIISNCISFSSIALFEHYAVLLNT